MERSIEGRLVQLNRLFYERFGQEFSRSRSVLQPGIGRALERMAPFGSLLDVGCGDARVGRALRRGGLAGWSGRWQGRYVGVDQSRSLLEAGRRSAGSHSLELSQADFMNPGWSDSVPQPETGFEAVVLFSTLHHVPGASRRRTLLAEIAALLAPQGRWVLSVWQLLHRERMRRKIRPWSEIGLDAAQLEAGDLLVDWKRGGQGLRYVHHFEPEELAELCAQAGLLVQERYRSDGRSGDLALYLLGTRNPDRAPS
jgi:SAM-dependent methyltransferase